MVDTRQYPWTRRSSRTDAAPVPPGVAKLLPLGAAPDDQAARAELGQAFSVLSAQGYTYEAISRATAFPRNQVGILARSAREANGTPQVARIVNIPEEVLELTPEEVRALMELEQAAFAGRRAKGAPGSEHELAKGEWEHTTARALARGVKPKTIARQLISMAEGDTGGDQI